MSGTFEDIVSELNNEARETLHAATNFAAQRGEECVDLQHWFHQMLVHGSSDLERILQAFAVEPSHVERDITNALERYRSIGGSKLDFTASNNLQLALEQALVQCKRFGDRHGIRIGHVILALVEHRTLRRALPKLSPKLAEIDADALNDRFLEILSSAGAERWEGEEGQQGEPPAGKQQALDKYTIDLTSEAREGRIDPIVGRDDEIRQVIDILMRRRQNNPILVGEAGVGKTAVVEGLALRIACDDVPPMMKAVSLRSLDLGLLQAGAGVRGEFEQRLKQVIDEVQASPQAIILFIDEAHTLIGAGGAAGTGDAANLLKPALARGALRTIAATTWSEYKKHIENDAALTRRFQTVAIDEPDDVKAILMLRGLVATLEAHHEVMVLDEAIEAAVKLSHRYIHGRQLPDKAVSVLDTACSRVAVGLAATPSPLEDVQRQIEALTTELDIIEREATIGVEIGERRAIAEERLADAQSREAELDARFEQEKALVDRILQLRQALHGETEEVDRDQVQGDQAGSEAGQSIEDNDVLAELRRAQTDLIAVQGEHPLIWPAVDADVTAAVVGDWTGIPIGRMVRDEIDAVLGLSERLRERVIGQDHALEMIAKRVQTARAGLENPSKPKGVFLLCGPSGVGKTETALALADVLYGGEHHVININMSEFQESHTVSTLKGAPPGYKGFEEGGRLTEAVRRKPYSVVLLDEVEKAHPDVHEIFFQVFDKGMMDDSTGQRIDFKNTVILLTSNVGSDEVMEACHDQKNRPGAEELAAALRDPLLDVFPPALLGRLVVIPYYPLSEDMLNAIIRLQLNRIEERIATQHDVPFLYDQAVIDLIGKRCTEVESGGRMIDAILTNSLLPRIGQEILRRLRDERPIKSIVIGVDNDEFTYGFDEDVDRCI